MKPSLSEAWRRLLSCVWFVNMYKPDWQRRREMFNHDWLKNQFVQSLGDAINLLAGRILRAGAARGSIDALLNDWDTHVPEASWLVEHYVVEMSPATIFDRPPLAGTASGARVWLPRLVHARWMFRYSVSESSDSAREALSRVAASVGALRSALADLDGAQSTQAIEGLMPLLEDVRARCEELGRAIERFRSKIEVT